MNTIIYDENLCTFLYALSKVKLEYIIYNNLYQSEAKSDVEFQNHIERVFAYELYRQWANALEKQDIELKLNGEISKNKNWQCSSPISCPTKDNCDNGKTIRYYPDLVLHKDQGKHTGQKIVCEIKRIKTIISKSANLDSDIEKLIYFTNKKTVKYEEDQEQKANDDFYEWGIMLIYGSNEDERIELQELCKTSNITGERLDHIIIIQAIYSKNEDSPQIVIQTLEEILKK